MTLQAWMQAKNLDAAGLARLTGFHRSYCWKVLCGHRPASRNFVARVIAASGGEVDAASFFAAALPAPSGKAVA